MNQLQEKNLFETVPVREAAVRLAVPSVIGQIILVLYNIADTFYIGLTGSDAKITALTICMPAFMFLSAIANLFGIGGASAISRSLGSNHLIRARRTSADAFWGCIAVTLLYITGVLLFLHPFINLLGGTDPEVHRYAEKYLLIAVLAGGTATSLSSMMSHLIRAEGAGMTASLGIAAGGILNIILDPLFMFVFLKPGHEVEGAAIATALSNLFSLLFFAAAQAKRKDCSVLSFRPSQISLEDGAVSDILAAGLPACIMTLCENISYACLDKILSVYGISVQAGIGVAKKINMLAHSIVRGIAQGMLPLIAYNYASGNRLRMKKASSLSTAAALISASVCAAVCLLFGDSLVALFIRGNCDSVLYGTSFLRILCIGAPFSAFAYICISFFQAVGEGKKSFYLALLRKGVLDIPVMFLLDRCLRVYGAVWATPIADFFCCTVSVLLYFRFLHRHAGSASESIYKPIKEQYNEPHYSGC